MFKPTDDFTTILNKCITIDHVKNLFNRKYDAVHLSELGCYREYIFKVLGYREVPDPESIRVLDGGNMWHEYVQETLTRNGIIPPEAIERKLKSKLHLLDSSIDISFMIIQDEVFLIDLKTIRAGKGTWDKYGFEGRADALKEHRRQVTLYIYYLNEELKKDPIEWDGRIISEIKKAKIIYIRKDGGVWRSKNFDPNDYHFDEDFRRQLQETTDFKLVFSPKKREDDIKTFDIIYDSLEAMLYAKQVEDLSKLVKTKTLPPPKREKDYYCERFCFCPELCEKGIDKEELNG